MNKVERMHISDIIDQTNLFLTTNSLYEIWKMPSKEQQSQKGTALDLLRNPEFVAQMIDNDFELYRFLIEHDNEIDKPKFLITLYKNYKERLSLVGTGIVKPEEIKELQKGLEGVMRLLKTTSSNG